MTLTRTRARQADAYALDLREEDKAEVPFGWRELVAQAILHGAAWSYWDAGGHLVGIYGVTLPTPDTASPWLLCSPRVARHRRFAMREARQMVESLRLAYGKRTIFNAIPKFSTGNRRFIESLGFQIINVPDKADDIFYLPCAPQPL